MARVPLRLWNQDHWELRGRPDSPTFFRRLRATLPTATTLFVEGASIAPDVREFYASEAEPGDYLPDRQTVWPKPLQYRLPFNDSTLKVLADLAERHAEPELADHVFVYADSEPLVEFPDAFGRDCPVLVSSLASEASLRAFAERTGVELVWMKAI